LQAAKIDGSIQRFGEASAHEVLIKTPVLESSEEGSGDAINQAFNSQLNPGKGKDDFDLNQRGAKAVAELLFDADPDGVKAADAIAAHAHYDEVAAKLIAQRQKLTLFRDWKDLDGIEGLSPAARELLQTRGFLGAYNVVQNENVGSQIGSELREKGILAVVLSLLGMLVYIWYRFELRFGIGALVASFHDFWITLGLFALANYEFNLSTIAAFLTLVGYSVNDTVVIFDRVRENMRKNRRKPLAEVMNESINQTMSRTLLTSGTTLLAVVSLFIWGGEVIRGFAFVMLVGVIVGTYSSVFVASPFALLWEQYFSRKGRPGERRLAGSENGKKA